MQNTIFLRSSRGKLTKYHHQISLQTRSQASTWLTILTQKLHSWRSTM